MPNPRRKARELVLKALYACEVGEQEPDAVFSDLSAESNLDEKALTFAERLFATIWPLRSEMDVTITSLARNWELERIAPIDKNILRLGLTELAKFPDIPKKVTINEAIELAKRYGGGESAAFINGILDNFARQID